MLILRLLLSTTDETEQRLLLLQVNREDRAACLEMVLELLVQVQWCLDLHQSTKLRIVVFNVVPALIIFFNESVLAAHRDVVDADVGLMPSAELDLVNIVEVNYMELLLLFMIVLRRVDLEGLHD